MGILEALLGQQNPFAKWAGENQNTLGSIGAGLGEGPSLSQGLANAAMRAPAGRAADAAMPGRRQAGGQSAEQQNLTADFLGERYPDLLAMLEAGAPMEQVWREAMTRMSQQPIPPRLNPTQSTTALGFNEIHRRAGPDGKHSAM